MLPAYAELHCLSNFTFLRGASHPEELVERAHAAGYSALALTDECSLAGVVRAHLAARECGLPLVIGSECVLDGRTKLVLLATDRSSYGDLAQLITRGRRRASKGCYSLSRDDVAEVASSCIALWVPGIGGQGTGNRNGTVSGGGASSAVPGVRNQQSEVRSGGDSGGGASSADEMSSWNDAARWVADVFPGRSWIAVELFTAAGDRARLARLADLGVHHGLPLVAAGDVHMHVRARRPLQDTLTAIRLRTPIAQCGYALFPNGERHLRSRARLASIYPPELLRETLAVADRCAFSLDELRYEYPREIVPEGETPTSWLRKLTERGLAQRYARHRPSPPAPLALPGRGEVSGSRLGVEASRSSPHEELHVRREDESPKDLPLPACGETVGVRGPAESADLLRGDSTFRCANVPPEVRELIEHELALIAELRYEPYFLTVHDVVAFARSKGILCQGRGSAANSAVCYALGVTEVDPSRMSMLFERFISRERNEPPDIDVDFEHQRREEVMQYVYGKYGRDRASLAATLITYRAKSAVRDVGKALGLDLAQVDRLAGMFAWWDGRAIAPERIREAGFDPCNPVIARLSALTGELMGFPRHLSQHVGGFVIARDLLERMVPIENAAMKDRTVIQWDKDDLDAMGLLKVDCLALGMLSAIRRSLALVSQYREVEMRMQDIPAEDPSVYAMIRKADTIGVFQIESRAQQSMLPRLGPACFYDLVIEVAIVRPGPIQGGMVHPYLRRRQGLEPVTYPSEDVKAVLERTLGVPIFQEQVMQLAIVAAGFTPGEADRLRRAMAAWRRKGGLDRFEQRLIDGMAARGYSEDFARAIYQQILGFGEYGFPESHSASFALLVYVSCWLKRHEPAAFAAALLNSQPMGFYAPAQLVADARRHGVAVMPVDVTVSDWDCTLESGEDPQERHWAPACAGATRGEDGRSRESTIDSRSSRFAATTRSHCRRPRAGGGPVSFDVPSDDAAETTIPPGRRHRAGGGPVSFDVPSDDEPETWGSGGPALRLGLRMISGLAEASAERIVAARAERRFEDVTDLAHRARLDQGDLTALADADALRALSGHRHDAVWDVAGVERLPGLLDGGTFDEARPDLPEPSEGQDIVADYRRLSLTLRRHPLAVLRDRLRARRLLTAQDVRASPHGRPVRTAGIVIGRQRPDTASGVVFVTLEDETGATNVIVWRSLGDRQRRELLGSRLLAVYGTIEREGDVVHVLAGRLVDMTSMLGALKTRSRDFH